MRFEEWEPIYLEILEEFGYSRAKDEEAARVLDELCHGRSICLSSCLRKAIGKEATVCGDGPDLEAQLERSRLRGTVIAADGATSTLLKKGIVPDIIVSDLDGDIADLQKANVMGAIIVIHAHGDNISVLRKVVHGFEGEIALTTQSFQFGRVRDYGGFTDGDRAVELARHFGAKDILLLGFDFENPKEKEKGDAQVKMRKLRWANRIIFDLNPPQVHLSRP
jgi:2-amino-4-hydroxy-6-hydroxymethyldihydropteridine diphosphokinase